MEQPLDPRDELTERLAALGRHPVDPALQSAHLTAMAGVSAPGSVLRSALATRLKLAAAVVFGFLLGTTGLASAGALGPLQPIAATVVEKATPLDVPKGPKEAKAAKANGGAKRYYGPECVVVDGKPARNRGQYLQQQRRVSPEAFEAAKQTDCGKPESSRKGGPDGTDEDAETEATAEDAEERKAESQGRADCVENGPGTTGKPECTPTTGHEDKPEPKKPADAGSPDAEDPDAEDEGVSGKSDGGSERRPEKTPAGPGGNGNGNGNGNGKPRPAPGVPAPPVGESAQEVAPVG